MELYGDTRCDERSSPNYWNFGLSMFVLLNMLSGVGLLTSPSFILLGILVSYLPQHVRIISRRSSEGISPYFVLLGTTSGTCAFANIITLPASQRDLACCKELNGFDCVAGLLGIAQVGVQWACFTVILLLFLLFFPSATPLTSTSKSHNQPTYRTAILVFLICILHLVVTVIASATIWYRYPTHLAGWAYFLGILGTCLAAIQFLPQIWTTWKLQAIGSLSIPMMCIQTPGSFVWVASLAARFGWEGWSTWGIYLVTGVLQGCLLGMAITFEIRKWRNRNHAEGRTDDRANDGHAEPESGNDADERTGLLGTER